MQRQAATTLQWGHLGDEGGRPILGLIIGAVIGVMVPTKSIFRSVTKHPKNNTLLMTSPNLTCSSVSDNQGNGQIGPKRN